MYDGIKVVGAPQWAPCFMPLYDVGMTGLYLSLLDSLAYIAEEALGDKQTAADLRARLATMSDTLNTHLWDDSQGIYSNKHYGEDGKSGAFSQRISPFNFFPMMSGAASEERAAVMCTQWLMTDGGFCLPNASTPPPAPVPGPTPKPCAFGMPSIAHNDSAYNDQVYWRGRVWGPMNYLVFAGLSHPRYANVPAVQEAKARLAASSRKLLLLEWLDKHHVHENFNAITGRGGDVRDSNPFYHWGALLGYVALQQEDEGARTRRT